MSSRLSSCATARAAVTHLDQKKQRNNKKQKTLKILNQNSALRVTDLLNPFFSHYTKK